MRMVTRELDIARHAQRIVHFRGELVAADEVVREPVAAEAELARVADLQSTRAAALTSPPSRLTTPEPKV